MGGSLPGFFELDPFQPDKEMLPDLLTSARPLLGGPFPEELPFLPDDLQAEDDERQTGDEDRRQKKKDLFMMS